MMDESVLSKLEQEASNAVGCDCDCGSSRSAFNCAAATHALVHEIRLLRASLVHMAKDSGRNATE